ncbi:MAG TPA: ribosomal protein S18-alanine N-acetyltransferase [Rhodanobacteraceae bacterium]|nr:ribosomal protein S18-alanine N-acetyltransferase [Rhodanobacteraceae bacterium]
MAAVVRHPQPRPQMRAMQRSELQAVMQVETSAYEFPWTLGIFRDCINSGYECWVLDDGRQLLGHGVMSIAAGEAHLLNLCVAPAAQHQGHGRHLLRRLIDIARWQGAERVFLEVRPSNPAALALYDQAGFNEIGVRRGYYPARQGREDAIVMALELLPDEPHGA